MATNKDSKEMESGYGQGSGSGFGSLITAAVSTVESAAGSVVSTVTGSESGSTAQSCLIRVMGLVLDMGLARLVKSPVRVLVLCQIVLVQSPLLEQSALLVLDLNKYNIMLCML
ncbi:hypothetical protein L3X38_017025 [Prunus dulcis]|uniref:Uncharacterized protein n=1 Tax=Prunus dulcis TaxID=3755 RepID=A0AAD4W6J8_PRUDU|nr:hypothetical protein L3X38_017025 [Prunus dulcis]